MFRQFLACGEAGLGVVSGLGTPGSGPQYFLERDAHVTFHEVPSAFHTDVPSLRSKNSVEVIPAYYFRTIPRMNPFKLVEEFLVELLNTLVAEPREYGRRKRVKEWMKGSLLLLPVVDNLHNHTTIFEEGFYRSGAADKSKKESLRAHACIISCVHVYGSVRRVVLVRFYNWLFVVHRSCSPTTTTTTTSTHAVVLSIKSHSSRTLTSCNNY